MLPVDKATSHELTRRQAGKLSVQHLHMEQAHLGRQMSPSSYSFLSSSCLLCLLHSVRIWSLSLHPTVSIDDEAKLWSLLVSVSTGNVKL